VVARPSEEPYPGPVPPEARREASAEPAAAAEANPGTQATPAAQATPAPQAAQATPAALVAAAPWDGGGSGPRATAEDRPAGPLVVARGGDERAWHHAGVAGPAEPIWRVAPGGCRADVDPDAWPVGFSPTGEALPDALTDVLLRGSHWVRSAERAEAERRERSAAVAAHVDAQLRAFLELCAEAELVPPVTMRVGRDVPRLARARHRGEGRPRAALRAAADDRAIPLTAPTRDAPDRLRRAGGDPGPRQSVRGPAVDGPDGGENRPRRSGRRQRGAQPDRPPADRRDLALPRQAGGQAGHRPGRRLTAWPVLYWRCESFPSAGRSLHLFVEPGGRTFEGRELPAPLTVVGRQVRVWPVDAPSIVEGMAEVDARRCALHLVDGMARLLWRAGVGL